MSVEQIVNNLTYRQTKKLLQGYYIITTGGTHVIFAKAEYIDGAPVAWLFVIEPHKLCECNEPVAKFDRPSYSWKIIH